MSLEATPLPQPQSFFIFEAGLGKKRGPVFAEAGEIE